MLISTTVSTNVGSLTSLLTIIVTDGFRCYGYHNSTNTSNISRTIISGSSIIDIIPSIVTRNITSTVARCVGPIIDW